MRSKGRLSDQVETTSIYAAGLCSTFSRSPRISSSFRTVLKDGFPSREKDLYNPARSRRSSRASSAMPFDRAIYPMVRKRKSGSFSSRATSSNATASSAVSISSAAGPRPDQEVILPHEVVKLAALGDMPLTRAWREHLGLTQEEMARRMDISQPAYAKLEAGKTRLRIATYKRIAQAMGIEWEQLTD